ncbi:Hypothetical predicted protein [Olea europaea subsp. europaea]|uniref:Uncharacterized protein n=1 Tax=Olea europaea subsp. europaea TaxID=158383 RepID=A0A8S0QMB4_OLEEU|nr:Hypothetical predicted protein [Olea europaea subsp. europaea]
MVRITSPCTPNSTAGSGGGRSFKKPAITVIQPFTSFWSLCTKRASRAAKKLASGPPNSPLTKPKQLLITVSNKVMKFRRKKNSDENFGGDDEGLWQRTILMGDKCEPLDFSGVIYYDSDGKQLPEALGKSSRASPLPLYA